MIKELQVSVATPLDAQGIKEVSSKSWLATYSNEAAGITLEDIQERLKDVLSEEKIAKKAEQIAQAPETERYFITKEDNKVVGYCHVVRYPDKNQLHAIYVLPEYAGKGIGTMLWKQPKNFFDDNKKTVVEVATYNINAINFYRKLGFKDTDRIFNDEKLRMKSGGIISQMEMVMPIELDAQGVSL